MCVCVGGGGVYSRRNSCRPYQSSRCYWCSYCICVLYTCHIVATNLLWDRPSTCHSGLLLYLCALHLSYCGYQLTVGSPIYVSLRIVAVSVCSTPVILWLQLTVGSPIYVSLRIVAVSVCSTPVILWLQLTVGSPIYVSLRIVAVSVCSTVYTCHIVATNLLWDRPSTCHSGLLLYLCVLHFSYYGYQLTVGSPIYVSLRIVSVCSTVYTCHIVATNLLWDHPSTCHSGLYLCALQSTPVILWLPTYCGITHLRVTQDCCCICVLYTCHIVATNLLWDHPSTCHSGLLLYLCVLHLSYCGYQLTVGSPIYVSLRIGAVSVCSTVYTCHIVATTYCGIAHLRVTHDCICVLYTCHIVATNLLWDHPSTCHSWLYLCALHLSYCGYQLTVGSPIYVSLMIVVVSVCSTPVILWLPTNCGIVHLRVTHDCCCICVLHTCHIVATNLLWDRPSTCHSGLVLYLCAPHLSYCGYNLLWDRPSTCHSWLYLCALHLSYCGYQLTVGSPIYVSLMIVSVCSTPVILWLPTYCGIAHLRVTHDCCCICVLYTCNIVATN